MLNTQQFGDELKKLGFDFYSGVPCSFLKYLINYAINECDYIMATNEGDAVAIAAGACLGGKKPVVLMQNSGLTNATSPLTSLNYSFKLPVLGFVSLRGEEGLNDEPQHELMGQITTEMLSIMEVEWEYLSPDMEEAKKQLERANQYFEQNRSFFFVVKKGTFKAVVLNDQSLSEYSNRKKILKSKKDTLPSRTKALETIIDQKDDHSVFLATTGKTGRELFEINDFEGNLYMVGSMGCASSMGLGLAMARPEKKVIVIDGDGALLMRMGALPTNAYYRPDNLLHILLDNNTHDSTGGQATISHNIDFVENAASVGYPEAIYAHSAEELDELTKGWRESGGLTFIHLRIDKGSPEKLGRPTIKPHQVKERLMTFINNH
ncbi:phosphonopyruvate decarboxylase [Fulvivirgaceae bacterium BMA10]|uniref:Phosphonopyruvate decarboxylase n=1 Tax=Splendidivirga corallicola TaxID=3051826 RepID=A0ABT8KVH1_9BACT|nr:phosphonopyruvate decarboxylase [Fulvivirgaceae bacterium BMA10]